MNMFDTPRIAFLDCSPIQTYMFDALPLCPHDTLNLPTEISSFPHESVNSVKAWIVFLFHCFPSAW